MSSHKTFAEKILGYHLALKPHLALPKDVNWLFPYDRPQVQDVMHAFFTKYFSDHDTRFILLGINPGRFGAGITGLPFTDPIRMMEECDIPNDFAKRQELSSVFVYDIINAMGGAKEFYRNFYITSICPLGFVKDGKNYNYYDSRELLNCVLPMIEDNLERHLEFGVSRQVAFSIGQGKNFKFLQELNRRKGYFDELIPLPHPRWVMQYRLKRKQEFIEQYVLELSRVR